MKCLGPSWMGFYTWECHIWHPWPPWSVRFQMLLKMLLHYWNRLLCWRQEAISNLPLHSATLRFQRGNVLWPPSNIQWCIKIFYFQLGRKNCQSIYVIESTKYAPMNNFLICNAHIPAWQRCMASLKYSTMHRNLPHGCFPLEEPFNQSLRPPIWRFSIGGRTTFHWIYRYI